jgi:hypothetical protein
LRSVLSFELIASSLEGFLIQLIADDLRVARSNLVGCLLAIPSARGCNRLNRLGLELADVQLVRRLRANCQKSTGLITVRRQLGSQQ